MTQATTSPAAPTPVIVEFREGKWIVIVLEEDERHEREFLVQAHAISYAEGQRIRLGAQTIGSSLSPDQSH
jgi:hypothetical protein